MVTKSNTLDAIKSRNMEPHYNDSEIIHSPVDGNSSGTNLMDIEHL